VTSQTSPSVSPAPASATSVDGRAPAYARRVYVANLVGQAGIIVTGAVVRVTGSGLGCPTWPRCSGDSLVPVESQAEGFHKFIEFGNRTLTFVLVILALASILVAFLDARRRRAAALPSRPTLTRLSFVPILGTLAQAVLGGFTVLTGLSPLMVGAHLLLSLVIVAFCTILVRRAGEPADSPVVDLTRPQVRAAVHALTGVMAVVVTVGMLVTASGPHAGDAKTPRLGLDPQLISWVHADLVLFSIGLLVGIIVAVRATGADAAVGRAAVLTLLLMLGQAGVGYVQYFTGLPWVLVALHALGAALVWWSTIRLLLATRSRGVVAVES